MAFSFFGVIFLQSLYNLRGRPMFTRALMTKPLRELGPVVLTVVASGVLAKYTPPPHQPSAPGLKPVLRMCLPRVLLVWW